MICFILTTGVSPSSPDIILAQSSSQHRFSSAVATRAEQRAKARYRSDQERSKDFRVGLNNTEKNTEKNRKMSPSVHREKLVLCFLLLSKPVEFVRVLSLGF